MGLKLWRNTYKGFPIFFSANSLLFGELSDCDKMWDFGHFIYGRNTFNKYKNDLKAFLKTPFYRSQNVGTHKNWKVWKGWVSNDPDGQCWRYMKGRGQQKLKLIFGGGQHMAFNDFWKGSTSWNLNKSLKSWIMLNDLGI